jgi:hypothetical protein
MMIISLPLLVPGETIFAVSRGMKCIFEQKDTAIERKLYIAIISNQRV